MLALTSRYITTPANLFHVLRRQVHRSFVLGPHWWWEKPWGKPSEHDPHMGFLWDSYGISKGFLWSPYMGFLWISYFFFHMGQLATQSWLNLGLVKPQACLCTLTVVATNWLAGRKTCPRAALMVSRTLFHESIEFHHRNGTIEISHIDSTPNSSGWLWLSRLNDKCDGKYV